MYIRIGGGITFCYVLLFFIKKAYGLEVVCTRSFLTQLRYQDDRHFLSFQWKVGQSELGVEEVTRENILPFRYMPEGGVCHTSQTNCLLELQFNQPMTHP